MSTTETPQGVGDTHSAAPAPQRPLTPPTTQRPPAAPQPEAAIAAHAEAGHEAYADLPLIDFDEVPAYVARTRIGGRTFLVPPLPASAMAYFVQLQSTEMTDDGKAIELLKQFIVRCFDPPQRPTVEAALDASPVTLQGLMQKGTELMMRATGVPLDPPSTPSPGGSLTDGGTSMAAASATVTPASPT